MVFFTCSGCGASLKKKNVDLHVNRCFKFEYLTCIDCSKDFGQNEYKLHTTCITEDEKYGKTGFKSGASKGTQKQLEWTEKIAKIIAAPKDLDRSTVLALNRLQSFSNVPRKKGKLMNFLKTNMKIQADVGEKIWKLLNEESNQCEEQKKNPSQPINEDTKIVQKPQYKEQNDLKENVENHGENPSRKRKREKNEKGSKKKKKAKLEEVQNGDCKKHNKKNKEIVDDISNPTNKQNKNEAMDTLAANGNKKSVMSSHEKFPWKKAIKSCLRSADDNQLSIKKLKKKIWNEYVAFEESKENGKPSLDEGNFNATMLKKINKNPKFKLHKERVKLLT